MEENFNTIIFSPHSDDVAYSLGGSLIKGYFEKPIMMVTVFTKSNFSPRLKLRDASEITKIRIQEDLDFANILNIHYLGLDFPEPPLRGLTAEDIFIRSPKDDFIYSEVSSSIFDIIKRYPDADIVCPLAIGGNVDHKIVLESCLTHQKHTNNNYIFYDDYPYAGSFRMSYLKEHAYNINPNLNQKKVDITPYYKEKISNLRLYRTQIGSQIPFGVYNHSRRLNSSYSFVDYLWVNSFFRKLYSYFTKFRKSCLYESLWQ